MTRLWQLLLLLFGGVSASFFEGGFDHHYTYSSESDILGLHNVTTVVKVRTILFTFEPRHEKTCLRVFRSGKTQTGLLRYRDKLES